MIKNIVFDIGRVLVSYTPLEFLHSLGYSEFKSQELFNVIFCGQTWKDADRGILSLAEQVTIYKEQLPLYQAEIEEIMEKWIYMPTMMEESEALLKEVLDLGYNIYLLSNYPENGFPQFWQRYPILERVHGYVVSYQEKLLKPEKEIYDVLLQRYQLIPEETVFIDDIRENIDAAIQLGIHGIVFENVTQAKSTLLSLGVAIKSD